MSEKPEALRFGVWRDRETEILRVSNTGEFLWHKDADARIANPGPDANPAMIHLFRALRRAEAVQAENERLREALKKYGQHRSDCAVVLGGYQCTCGFNQQEQTR